MAPALGMPDLVGIAERVRLGLVTATPSVWSRPEPSAHLHAPRHRPAGRVDYLVMGSARRVTC